MYIVNCVSYPLLNKLYNMPRQCFHENSTLVTVYWTLSLHITHFTKHMGKVSRIICHPILQAGNGVTDTSWRNSAKRDKWHQHKGFVSQNRRQISDKKVKLSELNWFLFLLFTFVLKIPQKILFTGLASTPTQSISCNVRMSVSPEFQYCLFIQPVQPFFLARRNSSK